MPRETPTLQKVSELVGLSVSTVSRALRDHPDVGAGTREKVKVAAKQLAYHPNWAAQALVAGHSNLVAFVSAGRDEWTALISTCARRELHGEGFLPVMYPTDGDADWEKELFGRLLGQNPAGVIWFPCEDSDIRAVAETLTRRKTPLVVVDRDSPGCPATFVCTDDEQGTAEAVRYLAGRGCRRLGLVVGPRTGQGFKLRADGFLAGAAAENIPPDDLTIIEHTCDHWEEHLGYKLSYEAGLKMLSQERRPDAVIGSTDEHAWGVLDAARDLGINVPEELRIIGFGDYIPMHYMRCGLSTIIQDRHEIVAKAIQSLASHVQADYSPKYEKVVVHTKRVIRDT